MESSSLFRLRLAQSVMACSLLLALNIHAGHAQTASADKDMAAMEHYSLDMDKIHRMDNAITEFALLEKTHPEMKGAMESKGSSDQAESLDDASARISAHPEIVAILSKNGFSPKDFVLLELTLFTAAFVEGTAKEANSDGVKMAKEAHVNPANVQFVSEHKLQLETLQKKATASKEADTQ